MTVVGFDDFQIAQAVWPPLTTIHIPTREVGRIAAEKLIGAAVREQARSQQHDPLSGGSRIVGRAAEGVG